MQQLAETEVSLMRVGVLLMLGHYKQSCSAMHKKPCRCVAVTQSVQNTSDRLQLGKQQLAETEVNIANRLAQLCTNSHAGV
jgi:hypothetical protein